MGNRINRLEASLEYLPKLKSYSRILLMYLLINDKEGKGIHLRQWWIMEETGLSQRALTLAIAELEKNNLLVRQGTIGARFIINL